MHGDKDPSKSFKQEVDWIYVQKDDGVLGREKAATWLNSEIGRSVRKLLKTDSCVAREGNVFFCFC